jgi:hypothetical protein
MYKHVRLPASFTGGRQLLLSARSNSDFLTYDSTVTAYLLASLTATYVRCKKILTPWRYSSCRILAASHVLYEVS